MKNMSLLSCFSHVWLCDLMNCSPRGSSIHGILQARILEWVATSIFLTQASYLRLLGLLHWQASSLPLTHLGSLNNEKHVYLSAISPSIVLSHHGGGLVAKSHPTLATPWTVACQGPLSMGFFRQEYWSGLPFPSPGALPDPGIEPRSPALQAYSCIAGGFFTNWATRQALEPHKTHCSS